MLGFARHCGIPQFVFASSSSVYGVNPRVPWSEDDHVLMPISPYAATKVSGELLGHVYARLFGIRFLALRFFTVYGPRQRPDLAIHRFARMMQQHRPIPVFGDGTTRRDYTYVEEIVQGILAAIDYDRSPFEIINLGSSRTIPLVELIATLEDALRLKATLRHEPEQPGDVPQTYANVAKAKALLGFEPRMPFPTGIENFVRWLRERDSLITKVA
jgi:UDP-glucuronate 4-epimerase